MLILIDEGRHDEGVCVVENRLGVDIEGERGDVWIQAERRISEMSLQLRG